MKNEILYVLLDRYADHEAAFLSAFINCEETGMREHPLYVNRIVAETMEPVRSCGGFLTVPDYTFRTVPREYAAVVLIGGYGWLDRQAASKAVPLVREAVGRGCIVGAICNAASFLAREGFLNAVRHTGNGLDQLKLWGQENYTNPDGYVQAQAVSDGRLVTANGTGALEFARELLLLLKADTPDRIERFYRFNKLGYTEITRLSVQK